MTTEQVYEKMKLGEIDINNQSSFFHVLTKGLIYNLNQNISLRGQLVPHYILGTGDETMALEVKGQDQSKEPTAVNNENHIYTQLPRCSIEMKGINLETDQLTSPYAHGKLQYDDGENIHTFTAEFRRMPVKISFELTYVTDSFADRLAITQQIITKLAFIRTFKIVYLGQTINCSYNIPDNLDGENMIDFDEATTDDRRHKISLDIDVETNIPVYDEKTAIPSDRFIRVHNDKRSAFTPEQKRITSDRPSVKIME